MNLGQDKETVLYRKYLLPTMLGMAFNAIYIITDTLMIGKGIGETALVALNLLLPVFSVYFGVGYLFGIGGSVLLSVAKGNGNKKEQMRIQENPHCSVLKHTFSDFITARNKRILIFLITK